jgi:hypothetical protein
MTKAWAFLYAACIFAAAPANDLEHNARRQQEFVAFNPRYAELKSGRVARLRTLAEKVVQREAARQSTACSHQILFELKLMTFFSADFEAIDGRIRDLEGVLAHPEREAAAEKQNPDDGSWGACYQGWHLKLYAAYDHISDAAAQPFRFLDRVNSPEKLKSYIMPLATSDIARTGLDHAFELNESLSDLMRLILRDRPKGYAWQPGMKQAMMDLLMQQLRNPETGWWGERYVRDGRVKFVDDLSMTFHTVSYLEGEVPDLPKIVDTSLALKNVDAPAGWLWDGGYWNHNNMDVAVLFRYGWPAAGAAQRDAMKRELDRMVRWTLAESLREDGSFKPLAADSSLEEADYFGAAFLARAGCFDRSRRFWTDAEFAGSEAARKRIIGNITRHIETGGAGGYYYRSILEELH